MFNFDLITSIERYILSHASCKEYDLIRHLIEIRALPSSALKTPLSLFRSHFLVFNALYRLKMKWLLEGHSFLIISPLEIKRTDPFEQNKIDEREVHEYDALSHFYLDLAHLNNTETHDINALLDQFWREYFTPSLKQKALNTLELTEPVDIKTIKQQYRRLAMRHHPDRGGDADKLIAITEAVQCLEQYY